MRKNDIRAWIQKELNEHPDITSIQLAEKYRIPIHIVQMTKDKLLKGVDRTPLQERE
ncbi:MULTISPECIES: hypothetical protein [unclassified Paenibacillus]|uniref:hypothetical protein n=1 Tax=unclassified Paenibacillus TaxID=185978 RepID=UPI0013922A29|nr:MULTISPECIES: hypothetical protein [unclassified Paenibacillus]MCT1402042.1 hypothetical protein [Paenibacillus sp. p3-SID867]